MQVNKAYQQHKSASLALLVFFCLKSDNRADMQDIWLYYKQQHNNNNPKSNVN